MHPANTNYSFCPSCGKRIYNYEDRCNECGTFKVIFEELRQDSTTSFCKHCGCLLQSDFAYCPSCGNKCKKSDDLNGPYDYEATNLFLKIMRACRAALLAIFFAINGIWCSIFGVFYGAICIVSSLVCVGIQIYINARKKYDNRKYSYIFIVIAAFLIFAAVAMLIVMAQIRAEAVESIINIFF